jgi:uncharacterized protein YidB (DUF937 family)
MGLLDSIFGSGQEQARGGPSPLTLGLLALLAYRTYQGKGRLADMMGQGQASGTSLGRGRAAEADYAGRTAGPGRLSDGNPSGPLGRGDGGFGDILGGLLRGGPGARPLAGQAGVPGGGWSDLLRGGLGGLLGGAAAGTVLNGGLGDLLGRLRQSGHGDAADSWVGHGENRAITPDAVENALGRDTVQTLADESGRPYLDVLSELSQSLPETVDQLTPEGRMPTEDEAAQWV